MTLHCLTNEVVVMKMIEILKEILTLKACEFNGSDFLEPFHEISVEVKIMCSDSSSCKNVIKLEFPLQPQKWM